MPGGRHKGGQQRRVRWSAWSWDASEKAPKDGWRWVQVPESSAADEAAGARIRAAAPLGIAQMGDWVKCHSQTQDKTYWTNKKTGISQWERPPLSGRQDPAVQERGSASSPPQPALAADCAVTRTMEGAPSASGLSPPPPLALSDAEEHKVPTLQEFLLAVRGLAPQVGQLAQRLGDVESAQEEARVHPMTAARSRSASAPVSPTSTSSRSRSMRQGVGSQGLGGFSGQVTPPRWRSAMGRRAPSSPCWSLSRACSRTWRGGLNPVARARAAGTCARPGHAARVSAEESQALRNMEGPGGPAPRRRFRRP